MAGLSAVASWVPAGITVDWVATVERWNSTVPDARRAGMRAKPKRATKASRSEPERESMSYWYWRR
jgi:hypothetical protein